MHEVLRAVAGDIARFNTTRERVEMLVEDQARAWSGAPGDWLVTPLARRANGFYLVSADPEGQRRGREVLQAFLGPATATIVSVPVAPGDEDVDRVLTAAGFTHLSEVEPRNGAATESLLAGLEDALATVRTRETRRYTRRPTHVELLRDLRLALLQDNAQVAEQCLADLESTGALSFENLRFLRIELLGRLGRWVDLRRSPHLSEILRARRPRVVNEILLEMLWRTELSDLADRRTTAAEIYAAADLGARYGTVLSAVDVPGSAPGRAVATIAALAQGDLERVQRLSEAAEDNERQRLEQLAAPALRATPGGAVAEGDLRSLFDEGRYPAVVLAYLGRPDPTDADLAVDAVLECEDRDHAPAVLATVQAFLAAGSLRSSKRLSRDLADLQRLADNACTSWLDWCSRVSRDAPWPEAAQVARAEHAHWESMRHIPAAQAEAAADDLLAAWTGVNQEHVVATLDLLVVDAAASADHNGAFRDAVLLILTEQDNLSLGVRTAYLTLLEQLLQDSPNVSRYRENLQQASALWHRIASPSAVDWAIHLIAVLLDSPTPESDLRLGVITSVITRIHDFAQRLSARQRVELDALRDEVNLQVPRMQSSEAVPDLIWNRLAGSLVGIYSLLPAAEEMLRKRLLQLCPAVAISGNDDTKATKALRTLANRADYFIVDTWHATHAATGAIDDERSRDRQIMPKGRGVSAFIQALEEALT